MSTYFVQGSTMDAIADAINAKTGGSSAMTPAQMVTAIGNIPSGGGTINGIIYDQVSSASNAKGKPLRVTATMPTIPAGCFARQTANDGVYVYSECTEVELAPTVTGLGQQVFRFSNITSIVGCLGLNNINAAGEGQAFSNAKALQTINLPLVTNIANNSFYGCTALTTVTFGSINNAVTTCSTSGFNGCTQSGLTITVYTTGSYADTLLASIRNGATNATIIIKASEATTYNGTSVAAGDTMITSEVTP